ncbi:MAG: phosphopantetheine-binding protein [Methanobrevibacter sp.]|jgi:acyl carrier protein|nr:phosphopantetheine-binding protein [Methanobrevibacter sp.]
MDGSTDIYIPKFPLLLSGKINIKELPQPQFSDIILDEIIPPKNELEKEIFNYCVEILKYDGFGVRNSFIDMGFTSLSIIKLIHAVFEEYKIELNILDLLNDDSNIELIAKIIQDPLSKIKYNKHELREYYPLSPQQSNFLFKVLNSSQNSYDNIFMILSFKGDVLNFRNALIKTINLNPYIKTHFIIQDNNIYQKMKIMK